MGGAGAGGTTGGVGGIGGIAGAGGAPGTCAARCYAPVKIVRNLASINEVYSALVGRWQLCSWIQSPFDAPTDALGVEFVTPQPGGGGDMYYLVDGPSGQPVRGAGSAYQRRYDVALAGGQFQLNMHRPTGVAPATFEAFTCPEQFEIRLSAMAAIIARFP